MPIDSTETDELRQQFAALIGLQQAAAVRAAGPPRMNADAWRGPAFDRYSLEADRLADELRGIASDLAHAQGLARTELAHALA